MLSELLTLSEFLLFATVMLAALRYAGFAGLCVFASLSVIICNIQVLREAHFCFQQAPIALGSITCSLVFIATDIITEHYGPKAARLSVFISFLAQIVFILALQLTLAYPPQIDPFFMPLKTLFSPMPRLFFASILAYLVSQMLDIYLFEKIRHRFSSRRWLWLRSFGSTSVSSFVDTAVFSMLAWYILTPTPCTFNKLLWTYILGAYVFKTIINIFSTPLMYLSHAVHRSKNLSS